jgi:hypothetical protein
MRWPYRSDALSIGMRGETTGPNRGYEILLTLSRNEEGEREPGERRTHGTSEAYVS